MLAPYVPGSILLAHEGPYLKGSLSGSHTGGRMSNVLLLYLVNQLLGPKLLLPSGCVKLGGKNCVHLPSVGERTAN